MVRQSTTDPVLELFLRAFEERVRACRGFALGLYAEYLVAHLLGAKPSTSGTDPVDLHWKVRGRPTPVRIQVKSSHRLEGSARHSFPIAPSVGTPRRSGDMWVFARHLGDNHQSGWDFLVTKSARLRRFGEQQTLAASKLAELGEWVDAVNLRPSALDVAKTLRHF